MDARGGNKALIWDVGPLFFSTRQGAWMMDGEWLPLGDSKGIKMPLSWWISR